MLLLTNCEVRTKNKVQIFPVWTELIGQYELYCIAIIKDNTEMNIFERN